MDVDYINGLSQQFSATSLLALAGLRVQDVEFVLHHIRIADPYGNPTTSKAQWLARWSISNILQIDVTRLKMTSSTPL